MAGLSFKKQQLAAKEESVEGTVEALALADAVNVLMSPSFEPNREIIPVDFVTKTLSPSASVRGVYTGKIGCSLPLKGSGVVDQAPEWGEILRGCGFLQTIDAGVDIEYTLLSASIPSLTLGRYLDGKLNRIWGARGSFKLLAELGKPAIINFDYLGAGWDDADVAMLSPSYDAVQPPVFLNATFTVEGYAFKINKVEIDLANELQLRDDVNSVTGYASTLITGRKPTGSFNPELTLKATKDIFALLNNGTEGALSIVIGSDSFNTITITAPKLAITGIADADRNGIAALDVKFELNPSSGDDEVVINVS